MKKVPLLGAALALAAVVTIVASQAVVSGQTPTPTPSPTGSTSPATPIPAPAPAPAAVLFMSNIEFKGVVKEISPTVWTISGLKVQVTPSTKIKGSPAVGDVVKVEGALVEDGTVKAREIKLKDNDGRGQDHGHLSKGKGRGHSNHDHQRVGHHHDDED